MFSMGYYSRTPSSRIEVKSAYALLRQQFRGQMCTSREQFTREVFQHAEADRLAI